MEYSLKLSTRASTHANGTGRYSPDEDRLRETRQYSTALRFPGRSRTSLVSAPPVSTHSISNLSCHSFINRFTNHLCIIQTEGLGTNSSRHASPAFADDCGLSSEDQDDGEHEREHEHEEDEVAKSPSTLSHPTS
jgi:hypothetical protein